MSSYRIGTPSRCIAWGTLFAFAQLLVLTGLPSTAVAASNPIVRLTVTDPSSGQSQTFYASEKTTSDEIVLSSRTSPEKLLVIPRSELRGVDVEEVEDGTYVLVADGQQSSLRVTMGGASGPGAGQVTYTGEAVDPDTGRRLDFEAVTSDVGTREPISITTAVVIVVGIGAVLCLGVLIIDAVASDCAKECTAECANAGGVAECEAKIIAGVDWSFEDGVKVGCGKECRSKCQSMPISRAPGGDPRVCAAPALAALGGR